jgi:hypothetical protein
MRLWEKVKNKINSGHKVIFVPECAELDGTGYEHPRPAKDYIPDWYRKMPRSIPGRPYISEEMAEPNYTMKACTPLLDAFTAGYIQELVCDIEVVSKENEDPYFYWQRQQPWKPVRGQRLKETMSGVPHPHGFRPGPYLWVQPFEFVVPDGWSILITHPFNREDLPFKTMTAIVDTDKMPGRSEVSFYIKEGFSGTIKKGTPIFQVVPIKREKWSSEVAPYSESHRTKFVNLIRNVWGGAYRDNFWVKKEYEAPKCPYGHGEKKNDV